VLVLTCRPARVRQIVPVELPRPRDEADPEFARLKRKIMRELQEALAWEQRGAADDRAQAVPLGD
jgi:ABC-type nitrate/sulfonate/bicarbonate transport system ATPase subunit